MKTVDALFFNLTGTSATKFEKRSGHSHISHNHELKKIR